MCLLYHRALPRCRYCRCYHRSSNHHELPPLPWCCRQWYTDLPQNLRLEDGKLVLQAVYDPAARAIRDQPYTSARVRTFGKYAVAPSQAHPTIKVEARIKVPAGLGLWPAFWMLPADNATAACSGCGRHGVWAASGEIDILEAANDATKVSPAPGLPADLGHGIVCPCALIAWLRPPPLPRAGAGHAALRRPVAAQFLHIQQLLSAWRRLAGWRLPHVWPRVGCQAGGSGWVERG